MARGLGDLAHAFQFQRIAVIAPDQMHQPENGVHRSADFMAHIGQEHTLGQVGGFGLQCALLQAGVKGGDFRRAFGHQLFQALAIALQLFFGAAAIADVPHQGQHCILFAIAQATQPYLDRKACAIAALLHAVHGERFARQQLLPQIAGLHRITFGGDIEYRHADQPLAGIAQHQAGLAIDVEDAPIQGVHDKTIAGLFHQVAKAFLAVDQHLFGGFFERDVDCHRQHQGMAVDRHRREAGIGPQDIEVQFGVCGDIGQQRQPIEALCLTRRSGPQQLPGWFDFFWGTQPQRLLLQCRKCGAAVLLQRGAIGMQYLAVVSVLQPHRDFGLIEQQSEATVWHQGCASGLASGLASGSTPCWRVSSLPAMSSALSA